MPLLGALLVGGLAALCFLGARTLLRRDGAKLWPCGVDSIRHQPISQFELHFVEGSQVSVGSKNGGEEEGVERIGSFSPLELRAWKVRRDSGAGGSADQEGIDHWSQYDDDTTVIFEDGADSGKRAGGFGELESLRQPEWGKALRSSDVLVI